MKFYQIFDIFFPIYKRTCKIHFHYLVKYFCFFASDGNSCMISSKNCSMENQNHMNSTWKLIAFFSQKRMSESIITLVQIRNTSVYYILFFFVII